MRVLQLHNRYQWPGGEDVVAQDEATLLRRSGYEVRCEELSNEEGGGNFLTKIRVTVASDWSSASHRLVREWCREFRPDVAHVHNFWMHLSPSVHAACHSMGVATVQTLHNYRLLCVNAQFLRNGKICEDCLGKMPWRGVLRGCYRGSVAASAGVARMILSNRIRCTWANEVDAFVALTKDGHDKFIAGGIPADKIHVKPNFSWDPGENNRPPSASNEVLYAGRLSAEKGVSNLLRAWAGARASDLGKLVIAGDGPERENLEQLTDSLGIDRSRISFLGHKTAMEVQALVSQVRCVVLPSVWHEPFGRVIVEAFAHGRGAIVSRLGSLQDTVQAGRLGLTVTPGNLEALGEAIRLILTDSTLADRIGSNSRKEYLRRYTPAHNLQCLENVYQAALARRRAPTGRDKDVDSELRLTNSFNHNTQSVGDPQ